MGLSRSSAHPWLGQATSSTVDPGGVNLETKVTFESPTDAAGWLRRLTRTLPGAAVAGAPATAATSTTYYGDAEVAQAGQTCVPGTTTQYGATKQVTLPAPASGAAPWTKFVYDAWGRAAGSVRLGDAAWSCTTFDDRGRVTSSATAGPDGTPTLTVNTTYEAVPAGFKVTTYSGTGPVAGDGTTLTTVTDLLGRVISSTTDLRCSTRRQEATGSATGQWWTIGGRPSPTRSCGRVVQRTTTGGVDLRPRVGMRGLARFCGRFLYPKGYAVYVNRTGQAVSPLTGRANITKDDLFWHISLP